MSIRELAEQAGIDQYEFGYMDITQSELEKFAELVAAHEREECAKVIDAWGVWHGKTELISKAIRARSNT